MLITFAKKLSFLLITPIYDSTLTLYYSLAHECSLYLQRNKPINSSWKKYA